MAISRPFLLALLGAVLLGATFFAVQSSRDSAGEDAAPAAQQVQPAEEAAAPAAPAEPAPAEPAKLTAEEALTAIVTPGSRVVSGRFDLEVDLREIGGGRENDFMQLSGTFECGCKEDVPKFDIEYRTHDEDGFSDAGTDVRYQLVSTGDEGFVGTGDDLYRVNPQGLENIAKLRTAAAAGPLASVPDFDLSRWVTDPRIVGTEELDGVEATHVRGDISPRKVGTDIVRLIRSDDAAASQADIPANAVRLAERVVKRAQVDAWVGSDRVVRRLEVRIRLGDVPRSMREPNDSPAGTVRLSFELSGVNKAQQVEAPADVSSASAAKGMGAKRADDARDNLALGAIVLNSPTGFAGTTLMFLRLAQSSEEGKGAEKAAKAVADGKKVVILFQNPDGLDDRAMRGVMRQLDARTRAVVLTDDVEAVDRYGTMVEDLGVSQTPAVVLIDSRGEARLIEGYVDTDTLTQAVADAR
jgi:hypothetical protein